MNASGSTAPRFCTGQVITVFRSRLRDPDDPEFGALAAEILELARATPGFVDYKVFVAADGERVSLVTFADAAAQQAWRDHPAHRAAQRAGRDRFYAEYSIQVGVSEVVHLFRRDDPDGAGSGSVHHP